MLTIRPGLSLPGESTDSQRTRHALPLPVCPFARQGLGSRLMQRCPGYAPQAVTFRGLGAGESLGERISCGHLGTQRGPRGFVTACRHPGGVPTA